jgi:hypothetical protein
VEQLNERLADLFHRFRSTISLPAAASARIVGKD